MLRLDGNLTPCETTLWVRSDMPFIISCMVCAQKIRGRLLQEVMEELVEHSTYCGRNLVCDHPVSQYSIGLLDLSFLTSGWCHWSVLTFDCGILFSSTSYSGFDLSLVQLIAWAENTYIGLTLELFIVSSTLRSSFSPSDESTARNSWRRV